MTFFNSALGRNITFVRPAYFIISGISGIPNIKYYYVFLFFVYIVSVVGNTVVALSVDRLIAIIDPLHYHMKVTHKFMLRLIAFFWILVIFLTLTAVSLLTRLSFCKSVVIKSYYCDHGPMYQLGCNDVTPSRVIARLNMVVILWIPIVFIIGSYCAIGYAILKISTVSERIKAFKTCTGHISLVIIYFFPVLITYSLSSKIQINFRIINLSLASVFPPMLNPIIYVVQTKEIKEPIKKSTEIEKISPNCRVKSHYL
ncbi:olfactory receptor-like protein COR9 [Sphaeramia orbicularis]|uniref:olfactory receptor-like protein COR9 n=1 Tax=Sphaeramia orbicularis TaxID=375764 RepID=UPI00117CE457|nr:olfactory receptor-like protein COR9 [Sphaeramia orbicularis]